MASISGWKNAPVGGKEGALVLRVVDVGAL